MLKPLDGELKTKRILKLFERLKSGSFVLKKHLSEEFNVSEKAIQRDLDLLRDYLSEMYPGEDVCIKYQKGKGYSLSIPNSTRLSVEETMLLTKILLESRAFPKSEMEYLIEKITAQCEVEDRKHIHDMIRNEIFLYQPVSHNKPLAKVIGGISRAISEQRLLEMVYMRAGEQESVSRIVEPLGIMFSEYYFYLIANISGAELEYPAIYRLDRIIDYSLVESHFRRDERLRFQEGEFRKQVQFMQTGRLLRVQFRYYGQSIEAVVDRLPNANVTKEEEGSYLVEAKVFGRGIKMWLLSQAENVEVLSPSQLRGEIQESIRNMSEHYRDKAML